MIYLTRRQLIESYVFSINNTENIVSSIIAELVLNNMDPKVTYIIEDKITIKGL